MIKFTTWIVKTTNKAFNKELHNLCIFNLLGATLKMTSIILSPISALHFAYFYMGNQTWFSPLS